MDPEITRLLAALSGQIAAVRQDYREQLRQSEVNAWTAARLAEQREERLSVLVEEQAAALAEIAMVLNVARSERAGGLETITDSMPTKGRGSAATREKRFRK